MVVGTIYPLGHPQPAISAFNEAPVVQHIENTIKPAPVPKPDFEVVLTNLRATQAAEAQRQAAIDLEKQKELEAAAYAQAHVYQYTAPTPDPNVAGNVALGQQMAAARGWTGDNWTALYNLYMRESGWRTTAQNPSSSACGIPQNINGCTYGYEPAAQISWGLDYIAGRYGTPLNAWAHSQSFNWY